VGAFVESYQGKRAIDSLVSGRGSPFSLGTKRRYRASGIFNLLHSQTAGPSEAVNCPQQASEGPKFVVKDAQHADRNQASDSTCGKEASFAELCHGAALGGGSYDTS
jgi:hypothetical protein